MLTCPLSIQFFPNEPKLPNFDDKNSFSCILFTTWFKCNCSHMCRHCLLLFTRHASVFLCTSPPPFFFSMDCYCFLRPSSIVCHSDCDHKITVCWNFVLNQTPSVVFGWKKSSCVHTFCWHLLNTGFFNQRVVVCILDGCFILCLAFMYHFLYLPYFPSVENYSCLSVTMCSVIRGFYLLLWVICEILFKFNLIRVTKIMKILWNFRFALFETK